ncbi:MAG: fumarate hydratase C-terminal domain-containing protein [Lachnospiraceae bacterium]|nr:fumarate hydratase C-terminal domain-containing protein [Lachnospiraceae bacterium]
MKRLNTPIREEDINDLKVGDMVYLSGEIYCGRDAVLPMIVSQIDDWKDKLQGSVIFHTAVSVAGVGPTSSNKLEIENSIEPLSKAGVKLHLGKGRLRQDTIEALNDHNSIYAVMAPVTALLNDKTISKEIVGFEELGMEAFHKLKVIDYPIIVAAAHGRSIFDEL